MLNKKSIKNGIIKIMKTGNIIKLRLKYNYENK